MSFAAYTAQELNQLAERLSAAAAREIDAATEQATAALQPGIDALRAELEALRAEHEQLAADDLALRSELDRLTGDKEALRADHARLAASEADLRNQIEQLTANEAALRAAEAALRDEHEQLRAASERAGGEHAQLAADYERLRFEYERVQAEHVQLTNDASNLNTARAEDDRLIQQTRNLLEAARADALRLTDELERHAAANATLTAQLSAARASHRHTVVERLQGVFDEIVQGRSVEAVLAAVADGLRDDFSRVAVFTIRDNRLEPKHQYGFDAKSGIGKVLIPLTVDSLFTRAIDADRVCAVPSDAVADAGGPPFGGSPSCIVTAPVKIRGDVLAVIYADDSGRANDADDADDRVKLADLLRQCAVLRLERLTIELKTMAELRAYAKMLLDEVEYVYSSDLAAGKTEAERQDRLYENLRCARQIYQQRVTVEGPAAATLLDEHIVATADAKASTPYGQDLAVVATRPDQTDSTAAAQAS